MRALFKKRDRQSGQAMVETAITMPLFVFIILGCLQLGLAHQARLMTKYAAFKAVRVGSMLHGRRQPMTNAAIAVLVPVISKTVGGKHYFYKARSSSDYLMNVNMLRFNNRHLPSNLPIVRVTVCSPTHGDQTRNTPSTGMGQTAAFTTGQQVNFDLPQNLKGDSIENWERTRLAIEVELNYLMPIPFANMMLYYIFNGQADRGQSVLFRQVTRIGGSGYRPTNWNPMDPWNEMNQRDFLARNGQYVIPIRAHYGMRMQSDLFPVGGGPPSLEATNRCVVPHTRTIQG